MTLLDRVKAAGVPAHVGMIMDGNGRWATARGLPRNAGHQAGVRTAERLIRFAGRRLGLRHLTLYAFSTENWSRPEAEVSFLFDLLRRFIAEKLAEFVAEGVKVTVSGDAAELPPALREEVARATAATAGSDRLWLNVALNYGARREILRACQAAMRAAVAGTLRPDGLDEEAFSRLLYTDGMPDPDLIIRTSGEVRLSNFLLWQAAYAELHFTRTLWPDFTAAEFLSILSAYQERERRFGGLVGEER